MTSPASPTRPTGKPMAQSHRNATRRTGAPCQAKPDEGILPTRRTSSAPHAIWFSLLLALISTHSVAADVAAAPDHVVTSAPPALRALLEGRVDDAQSLLHSTLSQNPEDATAHQLLCRVFYAQDQADSAIHECELAVADTPASDTPRASDNQLWLGRAYGMKARHAGPIAAFTLARKVRTSFQAAAQLNPSNLAALSDLGEYYVAAPSIVGGGDDKARALAARILPQFPAASHRILAMLAESNKDLPAAEQEYKLAVATARGSEGHPLAQAQSEAQIDLAHFYESHKRPDEAVAAIRAGLAVDRAHGPVLVDASSILTAAHREPALAEKCLRDYLAGHARSDAAPAFKVHLQLSRLLASRGDSAEAGREAATAAALAPAYTHSAHAAQGI